MTAISTADTVFPFSAIVGQAAMKRALILAAIHPGIGGVLVRGSKGSAKSTAVRALAALLPAIDVFEGDPFARAPEEDIPGWPLPESANRISRPVALINLPVGATDDRVVGSLNLERALATGQRAFEPGLLASAHRGILYIDEVNLLGDHLVDLLLDAAAMGVNHVEREGLAFRHPARFVLVGTMNPEEGDLRPQLLDRFGLAVEVEPMSDPAQRAEVVRRRLAFETDPARFREQWAKADQLEGERIAAARERLSEVVVPEPVLAAICARCAREGADGLRADLTIYKAAAALAAYEGRTQVTAADAEAVAELALAHRRTNPPPPSGPPPSGNDRNPPERERESTGPYLAGDTPRRAPSSAHAEGVSDDQTQTADPGTPQVQAPALPSALDPWVPRLTVPRRAPETGSRGSGASAPGAIGAFVGARVPRGRVRDPAIAATIRAAAPWQMARERLKHEPIIIRARDIREKIRARPARHLILFVVDASRSMGARERMKQTKAAVLSLLVEAYQKRDRVGLITFGGASAQLVLPPTRSVRVAARHLADLPVGGTTPLAAGLDLAGRVVERTRRKEPGVAPLIVLLSDGRGNVSLCPGADPHREALALAGQLARQNVPALVIDTETGPVRLGRAQALAAAWSAPCRPLDELKGPLLSEAVRRALWMHAAS